ncbi:hypothetical protein [Escherichia sp. E4736]|nr:hypothetical protein [Escherichia sp. E4736]
MGGSGVGELSSSSLKRWSAAVTVKEQNEPVAQVSQWKRYDSRTSTNRQ